GGRQGHVPGRRRRRTGLPAAGQEGPGDDRVPAAGDRADRRRGGLPAARWRAHHRPELADVPHVRRPLHQGPAASRGEAGGPGQVVGGAVPPRERPGSSRPRSLTAPAGNATLHVLPTTPAPSRVAAVRPPPGTENPT